ncbi:hypothetical protein ACQP1V_13530 [Microtetraspora malaysiensis]|uniref:hypothetical protein n=1 Tax=Microtetraspora malaysiensis TaxID=161358 RepID=UPI003D91BA2B
MAGALARASAVMGRPLVVTAGALVKMARTLSAGAEALVQAALAVTARTPRARMLLVVTAE